MKIFANENFLNIYFFISSGYILYNLMKWVKKMDKLSGMEKN